MIDNNYFRPFNVAWQADIMALPSAEAIVQANGIELWTQTFGNPGHPPMILIMGLGAQGIMWPQEFCESLAKKGYHVLRYDHRDVGLSSTIDFKTHPYTLREMAGDVIAIMDHYGLEKAHIVGASMGGVIAQLLGAYHPGRVHSLTLMMTTPNLRPAIESFLGNQTEYPLPPPDPRVLEQARKMSQKMPETLDEKIELFVANFKINTGSLPVDEGLCRSLACQAIPRMINPEPANNHIEAIRASYGLCDEALQHITVPTHIMHGNEDPVLPLAHGYALHDQIRHSTFSVVYQYGHCLANSAFFEPIIRDIVSRTKSAKL